MPAPDIRATKSGNISKGFGIDLDRYIGQRSNREIVDRYGISFDPEGIHLLDAKLCACKMFWVKRSEVSHVL